MKDTKLLLKALFSTIILFFPLTASFAGIQFGEGDINEKDQVLFTLKHEIPGVFSYRTLFRADIKNGTAETRPEILTCFPEQMELLSQGSILQIRNRYGTAQYNLDAERFHWLETSQVIPENSNRTAPFSTSPDGKYTCYVEKTDFATGNLVLRSTATGKTKVLSQNAAFSYKQVPAKWQSDSSIVVYEKDSHIYFGNPDAIFKGVEVNEEYRSIGKGSINSVNWTGDRYLIYIDGDMIYRIGTKELYTLGLYSGIIGKGTAIGRLPVQFRPKLDTFSINKDLTGLVLVQGGNQFTFYELKGPTCDYLRVVSSRPYNNNKSSFLEAEIVWANVNPVDSYVDPIPAIWVRCIPYSGARPEASVFKMNEQFTQLLSIEDSGLPVVSPDKSKCAFYAGSTLYVYNTSSWKRIGELSGERPVSILWKDKSTLICGGEKSIRRWNVNTNEVQTLMLSSASQAYWDSAEKIQADTGSGKCYIYNENRKIWQDNGVAISHVPVVRNANYRVFCGKTSNALYDNAIYIRTLAGKPVTKAIFPESVAKTQPRKKCALIFDAYDNADGLSDVLYELSLYNVTGTFFLNGEFIRRYPNESKQLANGKNECGSLFFATTTLVSGSYIIDEEFIRRGLARNEDDFYNTTGKELSLLWHAPFFAKSERIIQAGKNAGYTYVDAIKDTVNLPKLTKSEQIDFFMGELKKNDFGIIPINVGETRYLTSENLYQNLDLLLSAILDEGLDIVPVRDLLN